MQGVNIESLKGFNSYLKVYKSSKRFNHPVASLAVCYKPCDIELKQNIGNGKIIYGITVTKRTAKKAVVRNRIKRLIRESLRQYFKKRCDLENCQLKIIIITWKKAPHRPSLIRLNDVSPVIEKLLQDACKYYSKKLKKEDDSE